MNKTATALSIQLDIPESMSSDRPKVTKDLNEFNALLKDYNIDSLSFIFDGKHPNRVVCLNIQATIKSCCNYDE